MSSVSAMLGGKMWRDNKLQESQELPNWITEKTDHILLHIVVQAGAKSCQIFGEHAGRLKIRLNAKPIDGQANARLLEFLSDKLKIAKTSINIVSGESAKFKTLAVHYPKMSAQKLVILLGGVS